MLPAALQGAIFLIAVCARTYCARARFYLKTGLFDDDVEVLIHQAISVTSPFVASAQAAKNVEPMAAVSVIGVDVFATLSTRADVVNPHR